MASNFPTSLDSFTDPTSGSSLASPSHSGQHADLNDAVEKLEAKMGIGSSPASSASQGAVLKANGSGTTTYAKNGLWFVKTQTIGTGVTSVTVENCFSSDYNSYRIVIANGNGSAGANLQFQFQGRSANYYGSMYHDFHNGADTGTTRVSNGSYLLVGRSSTLGYYNSDFNVSGVTSGRPNLSGTYYGNGYAGWFGGVLDTGAAITVTGLTLSPTSGTFTGGTISIYGYQN